MSNIEEVANVAVFHMQLNTREAVRFIRNETKCTESEAQNAITTVATYYKQKA
jgi:hypothetical protein